MLISSCTEDPTVVNPASPPGVPCFNHINTGCPTASVQEEEFTLTNVIG